MPILLAALIAFLAGASLENSYAQVLLLSVGLTLGVLGIGVMAFIPRRIWQRDPCIRAASALLHSDVAAAFLTDSDNKILYRNPAAQDAMGITHAATLSEALQTRIQDPGPVLFGLARRAAILGAASETIGTSGGHMRMSVNQTQSGRYVWRIENAKDPPLTAWEDIPIPILTVTSDDHVAFMNAAAIEVLGEVRKLSDIGHTSSQMRGKSLRQIQTRDGLTQCHVVSLETSSGDQDIVLLPCGAPGTGAPPEGSSFEGLPVPMLKLARSGEILSSNREARELLCVQKPEGALFGSLTEGLGRSIADWLDDAAAGRGTIRTEILRLKREDREVFLQVTPNRTVEDGQTVLITVLSDATELKSLEAQFVQSQKMQAIGQLAGGVAHDFNNLLTAISGHCDLLLLRHDQADGDYADLMQISQNANRAAALVGQLLAYSRKQTLRPEVIDLRDTLSDLAHLLNRLIGEKVTLSLSHDPQLSRIRADKRQFEQVIMNLVVNARDAMAKGGEIRIETRNLMLEAPLRRDRVMVTEGRYVSVKVCDTGHGIPEDKLQKVFEPFFTTKRVGEGTGLGLSTAYGIVKQSGGFIFVDSTVGKGTCFQVIFPAHDGADCPAPRAAVPTGRAMAQAEGVVLLVEDEAPVRAFASRALQLRGFTVLEAESAEDALNLLEDPDLNIDVFVTDVVMPGIDGPGWVQKALERRPDVRVIFMSGYAEETFGDTQAKIENSVFLAKPFSLTELTDTVQRQLDRG